MPCACEQCHRHAQTLGLSGPAPSKAVLHKAFRAAAKLWHPDRFEHDPQKRLEAEEKFKTLQTAYSELSEHCENPVELPFLVQPIPDQPLPAQPFDAPFARPTPARAAPPVFGNAPGCFVAPVFSLRAEEIIFTHVREPDRALAIVDLSGHSSPPGALNQYILFTLHGMYVRDASNIHSLLWYQDLGDITFIDQRRDGKLPLRQRFVEKISHTEQKYALEIRRRNGTLFYAIANQADDSVKKVIYNFLQRMKPEPHR